MAITTISGQKENKFSTIVIYILGILGIGLVVFFGGEIIRNLAGNKNSAGISINTLHGEAEVLINGVSVGKTPYTANNLKAGNNKITLKNDKRQYETAITFLPKEGQYIHTVGVFRDLGASETFSSGQNFWFEKESGGNVLRVISEPAGALVFIDKVEIGKTPYSSNTISEGEYDIRLEKTGYEAQTARISIRKGFTLNATFKLFPLPLKANLVAFPESAQLFDLSADNDMVTSDTKAWTDAIIYWQKTRTPNASPFDYYLDYKGNLFDADGNVIATKEAMAALKTTTKGAYLGRTSDGVGLTKEAKDAYQTVFGGLGKVKIKTTPTGWLRVRDLPSTNGVELTRVNAGGEYSLVEEKLGWIKIKVTDTIEGWVSSDYVTKNQ